MEAFLLKPGCSHLVVMGVVPCGSLEDLARLLADFGGAEAPGQANQFAATLIIMPDNMSRILGPDSGQGLGIAEMHVLH
ncbi:hypothetical protein [Roseovarius sp. D0-M9]|uniref:hypothetical protein n=1 Tax=Roseovarius sp. D0-M9 TaxID=3127117 RepID=UPI00300FAADA